MASDITNHPGRRAEVEESSAIEYTLEVSDYDAVDIFVYDHVLSRRLRFRVQFYAAHLVLGMILAALFGMIVWAYSLDPKRANPPSFWSDLKVIGITALSLFAMVLVGLFPKSFFHRITRATNRARFHRARRAQTILGLINPRRHYRVILTRDGLIEATDSEEIGAAIEVREHKQTRVRWTAVARIDRTAEHAFFTITGIARFGTGYLILPRRAFPDEAAFLRFVETARNYREAAFLTRAPTADIPLPREERITR